MPVGEVTEPAHRFRCDGVVGVHEEHVLPATEAQAQIARLSRPAGVGLVDDLEIPRHFAVVVEQLATAVSGPVVHRDDLDVVDRHVLPQERVQALREIVNRVVDRDDDA